MKYVIIGNGPAGTYTATEIRKKDPDGQLTIVSDESYPMYSRWLLDLSRYCSNKRGYYTSC